MRYVTRHMIYPFKVHNLMVFSALKGLCHLHLGLRLSCHLVLSSLCNALTPDMGSFPPHGSTLCSDVACKELRAFPPSKIPLLPIVPSPPSFILSTALAMAWLSSLTFSLLFMVCRPQLSQGRTFVSSLLFPQFPGPGLARVRAWSGEPVWMAVLSAPSCRCWRRGSDWSSS